MFSAFTVTNRAIKRVKGICFIVGLVTLLICGCLLNPLPSDGGESNDHEVLVKKIIEDLQRVYFVDPEKRGKTYHVLIKEFASNDDETYAIVEELNRFWVIFLPKTLKKNIGIDGPCACRDFDVAKVRRDLVNLTRQKAFAERFTVQKPGQLKESRKEITLASDEIRAAKSAVAA